VPLWHLREIEELRWGSFVSEIGGAIKVSTYYFSDFRWRAVDFDLSVDERHG
jgi:hypothetical protein